MKYISIEELKAWVENSWYEKRPALNRRTIDQINLLDFIDSHAVEATVSKTVDTDSLITNKDREYEDRIKELESRLCIIYTTEEDIECQTAKENKELQAKLDELQIQLNEKSKLTDDIFKGYVEKKAELSTAQERLASAEEIIRKIVLKSAGVTVRIRGKINAGTSYSQDRLEDKIMRLYDVQIEAEQWLKVAESNKSYPQQ